MILSHLLLTTIIVAMTGPLSIDSVAVPVGSIDTHEPWLCRQVRRECNDLR